MSFHPHYENYQPDNEGQLHQEAFDSVWLELEAELPEHELTALLLDDDWPEGLIERFATRTMELKLDNHFEALVRAGLAERKVDADGRDTVSYTGAEPPSQVDIDQAVERYERPAGAVRLLVQQAGDQPLA